MVERVGALQRLNGRLGAVCVVREALHKGRQDGMDLDAGVQLSAHDEHGLERLEVVLVREGHHQALHVRAVSRNDVELVYGMIPTLYDMI